MLLHVSGLSNNRLVLSKLPVTPDYGIDDLTTLDATYRSKLRLTPAAQQIYAAVAHHESPAPAASQFLLD
ncbi:MAG: hypothetical protein Q8L74_06950 [Nitrospirota bacterium]|nr:hypothetical protein [Nitrospirota bacterium]MDP2384035.1 hypothetical protein [Nitrospirota bacterium]MDP3598510.1 hypothetical protein [Nitrospirota bacterium]